METVYKCRKSIWLVLDDPNMEGQDQGQERFHHVISGIHLNFQWNFISHSAWPSDETDCDSLLFTTAPDDHNLKSIPWAPNAQHSDRMDSQRPAD